MKKRYISLFPPYKDIHFYKDPGQVPFRFMKLGYNVKIVCYKNEKYYYETIKYLHMQNIPNNRLTRKYDLGMVTYLIINSLKIDILNIYHLNFQSLLFAFIYKLINPLGFVYLKMDNCHYSGTYPWEKIFDQTKKPDKIFKIYNSKKERRHNKIIKKYFINKIDLWSVEDEGSRKYYEKNYQFLKNKFITVFNGHAIDLNKKYKLKSYSEKENIISTASNLGTYNKATDILMESFRRIVHKCNYDLHLAGTIEPQFEEYIYSYFKKNPELKNRVIFHGSLKKDELYDLYNRSKIFCLPSKFEGFAVVFPEAMYFKNAIITTPYVSPRDLIKDHRIGLIVEKDDPKALAKALIKLIRNNEMMKKYGKNAHRFAKQELNWDNIILKLNKEIERRTKI
jgi:L-malate glycosyltransferase